MKQHRTIEDLQSMNRIKRFNIVNSITGIKPANLIGTRSADGSENLAIFSSVVHLGSDPALIGFILRPQGDVPRNTYENILETNYYTINGFTTSLMEKAHYTSAKFPKEISEFEQVKLTAEYIPGFPAPFVAECPIQIGLEYQSTVPIPINGTSLIIGKVIHLIYPKSVESDSGIWDLSEVDLAGISGLNSYYKLTQLAEFPFARPEELPKF